MHGLTITEMAKKLGITYLTAKQRLLRLGIKPISKEAIYEESALEAIRNVPGKGRPPKVKPEDPAKAAKPRKGKK
jgi:predicted ArsR family transcriptional regulator